MYTAPVTLFHFLCEGNLKKKLLASFRFNFMGSQYWPNKRDLKKYIAQSFFSLRLRLKL